MSIDAKSNLILQRAHALASGVESWADFSNALFDQEEGLIAETFSDPMELQAFYDSKQYAEVNRLLVELMKRLGVVAGAQPTAKSGRFVVRIPKTLHEVLDVEAKTEGVSLNQLVLSKLFLPLREKVNLKIDLIVKAYADVFDGYSSDRVVVDPKLNTDFLRRCRELGLGASDYVLNHTLYDIRKSGKAKLPKALKRTEFTDFDDYRFASEIAVRVLQRTKGVTLDRILCDPMLAVEFDRQARRLAQEDSALKLRWAALNLRKTHQLKPADEAVGPVYDLVSAGPVQRVNLDSLPNLRGTYVFYDYTRPIYAGETDDLRKRISLHLQHGLPDWLGDESSLELRYFAESKPKQAERLQWLRSFINRERPVLNYQQVA